MIEVHELPFAKCVKIHAEVGDDPISVLSIISEVLDIDPLLGSVVDKVIGKCIDSELSYEDEAIEVSRDRVATCRATCHAYASGKNYVHLLACLFVKPVSSVDDLFELCRKFTVPPPIYIDVESVVSSCREDRDCKARRSQLEGFTNPVELTIWRKLASDKSGRRVGLKIKLLLDVSETKGVSIARTHFVKITFV